MKRTALILLLTFTGITNLHANGPLMMKGFHHDIPFDDACKIMSTFKSDRGDFIFDKKQKKCGFGRNGLISYPHITGSSTSDKVDIIMLSPDVVDDLFESKTLNGSKFSKLFLSQYNWINKYQPIRKYRQESQEHGWKISINRKKWIKITFFKENTIQL